MGFLIVPPLVFPICCVVQCLKINEHSAYCLEKTLEKLKHFCLSQQKNISELGYSVGSSKIEIVSAIKTLVIFISENMSWDDQTKYVISKLSQVIGMT